MNDLGRLGKYRSYNGIATIHSTIPYYSIRKETPTLVDWVNFTPIITLTTPSDAPAGSYYIMCMAASTFKAVSDNLYVQCRNPFTPAMYILDAKNTFQIQDSTINHAGKVIDTLPGGVMTFEIVARVSKVNNASYVETCGIILLHLD